MEALCCRGTIGTFQGENYLPELGNCQLRCFFQMVATASTITIETIETFLDAPIMG